MVNDNVNMSFGQFSYVACNIRLFCGTKKNVILACDVI